MIKAIIFDLDGTLADTIGAITEALNMTLSALSYPLKTEQDVLGFINFGVREFAQHAIPHSASTDPDKVDEAIYLYAHNYEKTYMHTDKPYEGIPEVIKELKKDFRIGMLSNKQDEFVSALEKNLFEDGLFEIAHGVRTGYPVKPDPTVPLQFASFFGVKPWECAFVGDSDIDVATAKNSGMLAVDVCWGYRDEETLKRCGADYTVHTPQQLLDFFKHINNQTKD